MRDAVNDAVVRWPEWASFVAAHADSVISAYRRCSDGGGHGMRQLSTVDLRMDGGSALDAKSLRFL